MKRELYKKQYKSYRTTTYKNSMPLNYGNNFYRLNGVTKFYYKKHSVFLDDSIFHDEENYIKNYGNRLSSVFNKHATIVVERDEDKVSLKVFNGFRERRVGNSWFKISRNVDYLTVNIRTGDVYYGHIYNFNKKRKAKKSIKRNYFGNEPISCMMYKIRNTVRVFDFDSDSVWYDAIKVFMDELPIKYDGTLSFDDILFEFYLKKRGIKYPNNFVAYRKFLFGPEIRKKLKKCDNKLVEAFMLNENISGKKLKKELHISSNINLGLYRESKELFGEDWINQEEGFLNGVLNSEKSVYFPSQFQNFLTKEELRRVFGLFKQGFINGRLDTSVFRDHIRLYVELKELGEEDLKWMSDENSKEFFREEHLNWSDKLQFYRNGHYTRVYPKHFYDEIEQPIDGYYPVILNDSTNYNEESSYQSNCVKTYISRPSSLIISLRDRLTNSTERATIEYKIFKKNKEIRCERVQSLGRFNNYLNDKWESYLLKLDKQVLSCVNNKNFETIKIIKKCMNGLEIKSNSIWDDNGNLIWDNKNIHNSTYYYFIN